MATINYSNAVAYLHPAKFVPALHDRPCFLVAITLPCFDYLYPLSEWLASDLIKGGRRIMAGAC